MKKPKILKLLVNVGIAILAIIYFFVDAINLNPFYFEGALFWCLLITAYIVSWAVFKFGELMPKLTQSENGRISFTSTKSIPKQVKIVLIVPWAFLGIMVVLSSALINWGAYRDQLGELEIKTFSSDMQAMDINQIPIVDEELAKKLADKKLGERPSLGSQVYLGDPTIQMVDGKLIWAVPLHHSGFFKWITNLSGTPGYIKVSATNLNDVEYIDGYNIKYHPNSFLFHDLQRYLRATKAPFIGLTDFSFELDDAGQPYWVVSTYKNKRGFSLPESTGVIIVNASTGESIQYDKANVPEWVDRVQPENFIIEQIYNKGEYVHGIFNFSDKDKYKPSRGHAIVYNNKRCYLFTGLTSVGQDESAIGFMMVDMVTKQPILYQMNGATEYSSQKSAMGKVQHLEYVASDPIILNINDIPTYFMTLKDREGLVKQYAFVSVESYSNVGVGETIKTALLDYQKIMKNDGFNTNEFAKPEDEKKITSKVLRIASEFNGSETVYKILLEGHEDKIFIAIAALSDDLALTNSGDMLSISYYETGSPIMNISAFDNREFTK
ncbi:MAG: hypothetical protein RR322_02190 [Oscillospiraceae bacterium]